MKLSLGFSMGQTSRIILKSDSTGSSLVFQHILNTQWFNTFMMYQKKISGTGLINNLDSDFKPKFYANWLGEYQIPVLKLTYG